MFLRWNFWDLKRSLGFVQRMRCVSISLEFWFFFRLKETRIPVVCLCVESTQTTVEYIDLVRPMHFLLLHSLQCALQCARLCLFELKNCFYINMFVSLHLSLSRSHSLLCMHIEIGEFFFGSCKEFIRKRKIHAQNGERRIAFKNVNLCFYESWCISFFLYFQNQNVQLSETTKGTTVLCGGTQRHTFFWFRFF